WSLTLPAMITTPRSRTAGTPLFLLRDGIPANFLTPPSLNPADGQLKSIRLRAVSNDAPETTMFQTSFGMQREFADGLMATADFVYTRGSHMATLVNLNQ